MKTVAGSRAPTRDRITPHNHARANMKRFHLALAVADLDASITDYSARLGQPPQIVITGKYALWRTDQLNLSIKLQPGCTGRLRHVGFEDDDVQGFSSQADVNGIAWEHFSPLAQDLEIISTYGVAGHPSPADDELIRN